MPVGLDQVFYIFVSEIIKPITRQSLNRCQPFVGIKPQKTLEYLKCIFIKLTDVTTLKRLRFLDVGKLQSYKSWILIEFLLKSGGQLAKHFLNAKQLIDL